jgi:hypothetical protein
VQLSFFLWQSLDQLSLSCRRVNTSARESATREKSGCTPPFGAELLSHERRTRQEGALGREGTAWSDLFITIIRSLGGSFKRTMRRRLRTLLVGDGDLSFAQCLCKSSPLPHEASGPLFAFLFELLTKRHISAGKGGCLV